MITPRPSTTPMTGLRPADLELSRRSLLKYFGVGTAALGAAPLLGACGDGGGAGGASKFTVASFPGDNYLLDAVNVENKDFAKHDLDVPKLVAPQSGVQAMQLVVAGAVNGYASDTLLQMATYANGTEGKRPVIVGVRTPSTTYGIVAGKGDWPSPDASFEEKMQSLKGKRVGVAAVGAGGDLQLRLALELAGMAYDDVTHLATGPSASAAPNLTGGRIDAYVTVQWTSTRFVAESANRPVLLDFSDPTVPETLRNQAVCIVAVREDMVEKQPEVVQNWLAAQWDAHEWMLANKEAAADLLNRTGLGGKAPHIATNYIDHYVADVAPSIKPMFKVPEQTVEQMAELALRFGNIKEGDISFEKIVPDFARA
ncbi:ABC transporter substrate-binding protein [Saccharopolyspora shandongensis]|uniref:ABC transporter substrate-binding protein n=1 Tax=Saccharopolyspora shandongensis TaxID=418495 RepID=UPI0033D8595F